MKTKHTPIIVLLLFFMSLNAQDVPAQYQSYLENLNQILKQSNLPLASDFKEYKSHFKDDFEYIKSLDDLNEPYDQKPELCQYCDFTINKAELIGNTCFKGNCQNGEGILTIAKNEIYYIGNFKNNLPDGKGVFYFVDKGLLIGSFYKGKLSEAQFLGTKNQMAGIETSLGLLGKASYWYTSRFNAWYSGRINGKFEFAESNYDNTLKSDFIDLRVRQEVGSNKITSFFGTIKDNDGTLVEGDFDINFKPIDGDIKISRPNGQIISGEIFQGQLDRYNVKVVEGNKTYIGEVDENYRPHGRGFVVVDGKRLDNERWEHGKPATKATSGSSSISNTKTSPREAYQAKLRNECSKNWSRYKYCGIPKGNLTVTANGKRKILLINLSSTSQKIKIKPLFVPSNSTFGSRPSWETVTLPPTTSFVGDWVGIKALELHFPFGINEKHSIAIKGDGINNIFWVIE